MFSQFVLILRWEVLQNSYMTDSPRNSEFCFPFTLNESLREKKTGSLSPLGSVIKCLWNATRAGSEEGRLFSQAS